MQLFAHLPKRRSIAIPEDAVAESWRTRISQNREHPFISAIDERVLEIYRRAQSPEDPMELRDLWLGRVEHELGSASTRPWLAERWRSARKLREISADEVLGSRATVRFVKEMFNWYFRDDLYGEFHSADTILMSSGSVDERLWGLPIALKECIRFALDQDWYGYSDSRGRIPARQAIAEYENAKIVGTPYSADEVALTIGGTFAVSTLADFILHGSVSTTPALCATPNYPPLVETVARRSAVRLVPLDSSDGVTSLEPLIQALTPDTPLVLLQTVGNPTGAAVGEEDLGRLIAAASPHTMIILDECHEWLGPTRIAGLLRAAPNVVRVSSLSKTWSAPGLKVGWILAHAAFIAEYYEYASTTFGGPPSFFYTVVEVLAQMERWHITGMEEAGADEVRLFEPTYGLSPSALNAAYKSYRRDRIEREEALLVLRDAAVSRLSEAGARVVRPQYSINAAVELPGWNDPYLCFRDTLRETGVSVFPGILTFCFSGNVSRVTTSRPWRDQSVAIDRIHALLTRKTFDRITLGVDPLEEVR